MTDVSRNSEAKYSLNVKSGDRCCAVPQSTIRRCKKKTVDGGLYCLVHSTQIQQYPMMIQHFDGSVYDYNPGLHQPKLICGPNKVWKLINDHILLQENRKDKKMQKKLEEKAKLVRAGNANSVMNALIDIGAFSTYEEITKFFEVVQKNKKIRTKKLQNCLLSKNALEKAREFLGRQYFWMEYPDQVVKIQAFVRACIQRKSIGIGPMTIRLRVAYGKYTDKIIKIQKWFRHKHWLKNLPVSPKEMRVRFIPNLQKIIFLQNKIRDYANDKKSHSVGCPYSLQKANEIPDRFRIVYLDKSAGRTHWRYYDLRWLHEDFMKQTEEKLTLREPSTRNEFDIGFVVETCQKIWIMTRRDNIYFRDDDDNDYDQSITYDRTRDYKDSFRRRSFFGYVMCVFDILHDIGYFENEEIKCPIWIGKRTKQDMQKLYLDIVPNIFNIARDVGEYNVEEYIAHACQFFWCNRYILADRNDDEVAGECMGTFMNILNTTAQSPNAEQMLIVFRQIILNGFKKIFE